MKHTDKPKPQRQNFTVNQELKIQVEPGVIDTYKVNRRGHIFLHIYRTVAPDSWRKPFDRIRMDDPRIIH